MTLSPLAVIQLNGILRATNGASLCLLEGDGGFKMFPWGESGESVIGKWKFVSSSPKGLIVRVHGEWSRVNQVNRGGDFRTMELLIEPGVLHDSGHPSDDHYSCTYTESGVTRESKDKAEAFSPAFQTAPVPDIKLRPATLTLRPWHA